MSANTRKYRKPVKRLQSVVREIGQFRQFRNDALSYYDEETENLLDSVTSKVKAAITELEAADALRMKPKHRFL